MPDVLAENLSGKTVMGADGSELGILYNITMDLKSGSLSELIIEPDEERSSRPDVPMDEHGRYRVSVSAVQAVKDHIVVKR